MAQDTYTKRLWLEEDLADDLKWSMLVNKVLYSGKSKYQEVDLIDVGPFGKTLFLDGKVQSSEVDEWVYHELLVHPAMVMHPNPKTVFICGGAHKLQTVSPLCSLRDMVVDTEAALRMAAGCKASALRHLHLQNAE
eukprot:GHRQ01035144.1.p1 GENE.GHRQ01035144.1~~GHRQ01035144.1.p1  ORF type:complete len:136 (+),score=19.79 GHRQ01035144.1:481-888(+)